MILSTKNTTIAYRCPSCGEAIKSVVGVFSLSGDLIRLKCHCHESELKISYTSDGKIRLSVPCFACGNDHEFIVSKEAALNRELLLLTCPYTGIDVCFIGRKEQVEEQLDRVEEEIIALLDESGGEDFYGKYEEGAFPKIPDLTALPVLSTVVKELLCEGKIFCGCKTKSTDNRAHEDINNMLLLGGDYDNECNGDIELIIDGEDYVVRCLSCGAKHRVRPNETDAFCETTSLELDEI